ncbi:acyltransferase family protein [Bradyrhizobium sp. 2TAF24]|uniref:acyltransferase family protein n=1 Tax=Bradyrhizobium sp. 2TAF24 TaxID=3233011 RepID=UPI003F9152DE
MQRIDYLDGLRGVAAVIVVVHHVACLLCPALFFGLEPGVSASWQTTFAASPLSIVINGRSAVYVFFALSGFVIAASADRTRRTLPGNVCARVIRLGLPASASVILAGGLALSGWMFPRAMLELMGNHSWLADQHPDPTLARWLPQIFGAYVLTRKSEFNPVLWTMQMELVGSVAIYVLFALFREAALRIVACLTIAVLVMATRTEPFPYLCFCGGALLYLRCDRLTALPPAAGTLLIAAGLLCAGAPYAPVMPGGFYALPAGLLAPLGLHVTSSWTLGSVLLVGGLIASPAAQQLLSTELPRFLGRISFSLYLVHFPLLGILLVQLYLQLGQGSTAATFACIALYLAAAIIAAVAFNAIVDEPAQRLSRIVGAAMPGLRLRSAGA